MRVLNKRAFSTTPCEADLDKIKTHFKLHFPLNCKLDEHLMCVHDKLRCSTGFNYTANQCNIIAAAFNVSLSPRPEVIKRWTATLLYLFESRCVPWQCERLSHLSAPHTKHCCRLRWENVAIWNRVNTSGTIWNNRTESSWENTFPWAWKQDRRLILIYSVSCEIQHVSVQCRYS